MKLNVRNLFAGLVIIIVLAFVLFRGDQLVELVETMKQGQPLFMAVAVLTQLGKYFAQSFAYSFAFAAVGEHMAARNTLPLVFGTFFMNTIAPSLNLAGTTLVVDDARRRGIPAGKATSAALLMQITIDSGFAIIMLSGFLVLAITVGLDPMWALPGLIVLLIVSAMVFIMVMGRKRPQVIIRLLSKVDRLINRILAKMGKASLKPWVERTVASFSEAAGLIASQPKTTAKAFGACSRLRRSCAATWWPRCSPWFRSRRRAWAWWKRPSRWRSPRSARRRRRACPSRSCTAASSSGCRSSSAPSSFRPRRRSCRNEGKGRRCRCRARRRSSGGPRCRRFRAGIERGACDA